MNTSLQHLIPSRRQQVNTIIKIIVEAVCPEKIILFGNYANCYDGFTIKDDGPLPECMLNFDILVVTRRGDRRYDYEVQDIIENRCHFSSSVNILVHDIDYVNQQLAAGHYFFYQLSIEGILLYDSGAVPLAEATEPDFKAVRAVAEKDFSNWWGRADAFFRCAIFNIQHKEWRLAAFVLHQAAEQAYQAILLSFTGYKPCTHNLDKMRRYTNRLSIELSLLFPRDTAAEDHLFKLLMQGYVDARYKEEYSIREEELTLLTERISQLLSIAARLSRNRFISLEKRAA